MWYLCNPLSSGSTWVVHAANSPAGVLCLVAFAGALPRADAGAILMRTRLETGVRAAKNRFRGQHVVDLAWARKQEGP